MDEHMKEGWTTSLLIGITLIVLGLVLFLDHLGWLSFEVPWGWWPVLLVILGLARLWGSRDSRGRRSGYWLVVIGLWLLLNFQHYFGLDFDRSWPLLVIAAGGHLVWRSLSGGSRRTREGGEDAG